MKLRLQVVVGKAAGKLITIGHLPFVIGRDPKCQLRPASSVISKQHCAITSRDGNVSIQDFGSLNGTFVNDQKVTDEQPLKNGDRLRIGPLMFILCVDLNDSKTSSGNLAEEDESATFLLTSDEKPLTAVVREGDPEASTESTVLDLPAIVSEAVVAKPPQPKNASGKDTKPDTSSAAKDILSKYSRRGRK